MSRSSSFIDVLFEMALDGDGDFPMAVISLGIDGVEIVPDLLFGTVETGHLRHDAFTKEQLPASFPLMSDDGHGGTAPTKLTGFGTRGIHPLHPLS